MPIIVERAPFLGVSKATLLRREREGQLLPIEKTAGGQRQYDLAKLQPDAFHAGPMARTPIAYARI